MSLATAVNTCADRRISPSLVLLNRTWSSFHICGYSGLSLAMALAFTLIALQALSAWVMAVIVLSAVLTFLALAMVTKIIVGEERLIYYHHEIAVMASAALVLRLLDQPVLPYLDVTILGIGTFLVCGRVGCLMVGCCHGRPHRWGVCYRDEHAEAGFAPHLVGVRLFPIQAVESLWVLGTVAVGVALLVSGSPPGAALAWYVIAYDIGRFCFEFARGDSSRAYIWGFSEAQWTSLLLMVVVVWLESRGALPRQAWHLAATGGLSAAMIGIALARCRRGLAEYPLSLPRHMQELAEALDFLAQQDQDAEAAARPGNALSIARTSQGIQISSGKVTDCGATVYHYTLSSVPRELDARAAQVVARVIVQLRHAGGPSSLSSRRDGVFHLVVRSVAESGA